jgi:hypothetical protein
VQNADTVGKPRHRRREGESEAVNMGKRRIRLCNSVFWDRTKPDKVYMNFVQMAIVRFPFACRQVYLRFVDGPALDLSIYDLDRLVATYLRLRGIKPPSVLGKSAKPGPFTFSIPSNLARAMRPRSCRRRKGHSPRP